MPAAPAAPTSTSAPPASPAAPPSSTPSGIPEVTLSGQPSRPDNSDAMKAAKARVRQAANVADPNRPPPVQPRRTVPRATEEPPAKSEPSTGEPPAPRRDPAAAEPPAGEIKPPAGEVQPPAGEAQPPAAAGQPAKPGAKEGPWTVVERYKKINKELTTKAADLEAKLAKAGDSAANLARAEKAETALKEALDELRYLNYQKHPEFIEQYDKPFRAAWAAAAADLQELTITDADGNMRAPTMDKEMTEIVNLPLGAAIARARELFGDAADAVIQHRHEIRRLARSQQEALDNARKNAGEREKQTTATMNQIAEENTQTWNELRKTHTEKDPFQKPVEGDEEWNGALTKSEAYVRSATKSNPRDPKLSKEQRAQALQLQANIYSRAVAYPMLALEYNRLSAQLQEAQKKLASYEKTSPGEGDGHTAPSAGATAVGTADPMARAKSRIRSLPKVKGVYGY